MLSFYVMRYESMDNAERNTKIVNVVLHLFCKSCSLHSCMTVDMAQLVRAFASHVEGWVFESQLRQT